jgi:4-hydroxy-3-polyprenylbenzoate decarboxylase
MAFKDLREWMSLLDKEGELRRVKAEVNWDREMGAIVRRVCSEKGPALLFENIRGYRDTVCTKFFANDMGTVGRGALAINLPKSASLREIVTTMKDRLRKPLTAVRNGEGKAPVHQNLVQGTDVDLYQFPAPRWHHRDGGRYINTWCSVVSMDPDTGAHNVGTYRGMIASKNSIPCLLVPIQHWGRHFLKYQRAGKEMPIAVVLGPNPTVSLVSCVFVPNQVYVSEYEFAGGLQQEPVELVKCQTNDLWIPATAEIVLEGRIPTNPRDFEMEGPFGEFTGYYGGGQTPKPTIRVDTVTHRNEPILIGCLEGTSPGRPSTHIYPTMCAFSASMWIMLEDAGIPNVLGVWSPVMSSGANWRVQIRKNYRGHAKTVAHALFSLSGMQGKHVIVVDEDIDIFDEDALEWALAWRVNADMGDVVVFPEEPSNPLDPSTPLDERNPLRFGDGVAGRVLIDATVNWKLEPREEWGGRRVPPLSTDTAPEDLELINQRWKEYFP